MPAWGVGIRTVYYYQHRYRRPHYIVGSRARHTSYRLTIMPYQDRGAVVSRRIYSLLSCLDTQAYDKVAPQVGYWTELALTQQFTTVDKLVEDISGLAWTTYRCSASFARFLKEFRDSPHRSTQARSFVDDLSTRVFCWFAAASAEDLAMAWQEDTVASGGGYGFVEAASFVGHLIDRGLLDHELVRLHLIKPLTTYYHPRFITPAEIVRANAIYRLFVAAGNTLVQGLLDPEDVRDCFGILQTYLLSGETTAGLSRPKLEVQYTTYPDASCRNLLTRGPGTSRAPCQVVAAE